MIKIDMLNFSSPFLLSSTLAYLGGSNDPGGAVRAVKAAAETPSGRCVMHPYVTLVGLTVLMILTALC